MALSFDLRLLATFVQVARAGSISAAAARIGRTQSAVTMQMQRLEQACGQSLLHRGGGGVRLTSGGERLLDYAGRMLAIHDEAVAAFSSRGLRGTVVFGCPEDYLIAFFPTLLQSFGRMHPDVEIKVVASPTDQLRRLLHLKQVDLALVSVPGEAGGGAGGGIVRTEPLVWVGRQPTLGQHNFGPVLPLALSAANAVDHKAACDAMARAGLRYRISQASNSLAGLIGVTRSGLAISVMTEKAVPSDLHILGAPLPALPSIGIEIAYPEIEQSAAAKAFGAHIAELLPSL